MEKLYRILKLMIALLLFAVVIVGAYVLYNRLGSGMNAEDLVTQQTQPSGQEEPAETVPDFTVYDGDGNAVQLSDFRGKPVILNFWASWCGPCKGEMPEFQSAFETYGEQIQFMMVNLTDGYRETQSAAAAFVSDNGYTFPLYFDSDMDAAMTYGINAIPATYFIDAQGVLVSRSQGALSADRLQKGVDLLLPQE